MSVYLQKSVLTGRDSIQGWAIASREETQRSPNAKQSLGLRRASLRICDCGSVAGRRNRINSSHDGPGYKRDKDKGKKTESSDIRYESSAIGTVTVLIKKFS
ncbi:hypothetical protein QUA40_09725 [Microcoleus sp. Pol11C3]|uniref:hypothetical protein n=1 Tax=Microcoleus sp. Pol11C3 TaxID=3055390 RepID=UPI002FD77BB4